jgi:hypothetical protein
MDSGIVTIAVEGDADASVVQRVLESLGLSVGPAYVLRGKGNLDKKLSAYNNAAQHGRWLVLRDLDRDAACAPSLLAQLLPKPAAHMHLRIAVRAVEAWLLADPEGLSRFLKVGPQAIPMDPEGLDDPKQSLVNVARHSRDRAIREDMVPEEGTRIHVGPGYSGRVIEFASGHWNPRVAAQHSESLKRCMDALKRWTGRGVVGAASSTPSPRGKGAKAGPRR